MLFGLAGEADTPGVGEVPYTIRMNERRSITFDSSIDHKLYKKQSL